MQKISKYLYMFFLVFILQGCGPTLPSGPYHADAPKPPESKKLATIYIIFDAYGGEKIDFFVNEQHYFTALMNHYSWIQLEPGEHEIKAIDGLGESSFFNGDAGKEFVFRKYFDAGKKYYISLSTQRRPTGKQLGLVTPLYVQIVDGFDQSRKYKELPPERADELMHFNVYVPAVLSDVSASK